MILLHRLFLLLQTSSSSYLCGSCSKTLSINSNYRIGVCPTGYPQRDLICELPDAYYLFNIYFSNSVAFTNSSISTLSVASGTFSSPGNPFPTKERGFYFPKNSYLVYSESFIPSPFQSYHFYIRIFESGTIIIVKGSSTFLEIKGKESITLDYRYCGSDMLCTLTSNTLVYTSDGTANDEWIYYSLKIQENNNSINFVLYKDMSIVLTFSPPGENAIGVLSTDELFKAKIGNSNGGFRGFLHRFSVSNVIDENSFEVYYVSFCDPYYYLENNQCYSTSCPSLSPFWAVRSTCSTCNNNKCSSCSNYFECENPVTTSCESGCSKCTTSTCQVCDTNYLRLSDGIKTYCNNSILFSLTSNRLGDHIVSGSNKNTDSGNNPDDDDPVPSPGRGFYFDGDAFLTTKISFIIPVDFLISMWVYPISGSIFSKGSILETSFSLTTSMLLTSFKDFSTTSISLSTNSVSSTWQYYSIKAFYKNQEEIEYTINKSPKVSSQGKKILLDTLSNQFYLGKGSTGFTGFIAYFFIGSMNLDQSYVSGYGYDVTFPFGSTLNPCYESSTMTCTVICSDCDFCEDTSTGGCFTCPAGTYYDQVTCAGLETSAGYNTFQSNLYKNRGSCLLSFKGLACSQCDSPYVLYDNLCISSCPTGYTLALNKCFQSTSNVFSFFGDNYLSVSVIGNVTFGSTKQEYPNIDSNDPIPAYNRGYYFGISSYMTVSQVTLGPRFKLSIWIFKITKGNGIVIRKYNSVNTVNFILNAGTELVSTVTTVFTEKTVYSFNSNGKWQYYTLSVSFDPVLLLTTLTSSYNTQNKIETYVEFDFFEDLSGFNMVFGSDQNDGFSGFLYSIQIFNEDDITDDHFYEPSGLSCDVSPFENSCLSVCLMTNYYNTADESCYSCSEICSYGCVRSGDCVLCTRKLCDECSSFESSCITCKAGADKDAQGYCECGSGYMEDTRINECVSCASNCDQCNGVLPSECTKCLAGYKFYTNFQMCIPSNTCSGIIPASSDSCTYTDTLLISSEFNSFLDIFYDKSNQISFKTGSTSDSYPTYSSSDPWVIPGRGMHFTGGTYLEMDKENKFKFGPEFTISLWAKVYDSGSLFLRKDFSKLIEIKVDTTQIMTSILIRDHKSSEVISSSTFKTGVWNLFQYFVGGEDSSLTRLNQPKSVYTQLFHNWFKDTIDASNTYIGKFKGFIWNIEIYNYLHELLENSSGGPKSISGVLNECDFFQYGDFCNQCPSSCIYGCRRTETCSMCLDSLCKKCSTEETCLECFSYAQFKSGVCECILEFNSTLMACNPVLNCIDFCSRCYSEDWNACYQCESGYYLFDGVCISCPTGSLAGEICDFKDGLVFKSKFTSLKGVFYDQVSEIPIITGSSEQFYPEYENDDPIPAYLRGFYFDGVGSVIRLPVIKNYPKLVLSINWTVEIWMNPKSLSGCLFSYVVEKVLFSICFNRLDILIGLSLVSKTEKIETFSIYSHLDSWNLISVHFEYSELYSLSVYLNSKLISIINGESGFLSNYSPGLFYEIGKSDLEYFEGFIYQIEVFSGDSIHSDVNNSSDCLNAISGFCIPDCSIDEYWTGPKYNDCESCKSGCFEGCRGNDSCNLCADPLCYKCDDFEQDSCLECSPGSSNTNNCACDEGRVLDYEIYSCVECRSNEFFHENSCVKCPDLCISCSNLSNCQDCIDNSEIKNNICVCKPGYVFENSCEERWFFINASITSGTNIDLEFSEDLMNDLNKSDFKIFTKNLQKYSLIKLNSRNYLVSLSINGIIKDGTEVKVEIISLILSKSGSKLNDSMITLKLDSNEYEVFMDQGKHSGKIVSKSLTSSAITLSLVNFNLATLWSFLNDIQIILFIGLSSADIPPRFFGYLKGLKDYNLFPNIFLYFLPYYVKDVNNYDLKGTYQRAQDFGYNSKSLLVNIGSFITAFIFLVSSWIINFILSKLTRFRPFNKKNLKKLFKKKLNEYKYNAFLRFWITCYLEIFAGSLFGIIFKLDVSLFLVLNFIFSLIILFMVFITPVLFYTLTKINKENLKNSEESFLSKFGTLYEEFDIQKNYENSMFYMFFFLRRIFYVFILIFFRNYPTFQIFLNLFLSFWYLIYLIVMKPFKDKYLNLCNLISEFMVILIFFILLLCSLKITSSHYDIIDSSLLIIVNISLSSHLAYSLFLLFQTILKFIKFLKSRCTRTINPSVTLSVSEIMKNIED